MVASRMLATASFELKQCRAATSPVLTPHSPISCHASLCAQIKLYTLPNASGRYELHAPPDNIIPGGDFRYFHLVDDFEVVGTPHAGTTALSTKTVVAFAARRFLAGWWKHALSWNWVACPARPRRVRASSEIRPRNVLSGAVWAIPSQRAGAIDKLKWHLLEACLCQWLRLWAEAV